MTPFSVLFATNGIALLLGAAFIASILYLLGICVWGAVQMTRARRRAFGPRRRS